MICTVTIDIRDQKYTVTFNTLSDALIFYNELLADDNIVKAQLTSNLATQPVAQFDRSSTTNGTVYNIIG